MTEINISGRKLRFRERLNWLSNSTVYNVFGASSTASPPENKEEIDKTKQKQSSVKISGG